MMRVPVSFSLALAAVPVLFLNPHITPVMLLQRMMVSYGSFIFLSVPFFILAALIMNSAGITDRLMRLARALVGVLPGGLSHVNVMVSMLFAGISGSSNADAGGIGSIMIPAMIKEGYDKKYSVAVTACSAVMGVIIPPSIVMIIWGGIMNVSVAALFLAGIVPGVLIGLAQIALGLLFAWKRHYPRISGFSIPEILISLRGSLLALFSPLIIIGGIVGGIFTPTEASLAAVVYSLILGFVVYRTVDIREFARLMLASAKLSALALFAVGTASIFGWVLAYYRVPVMLVDWLGPITNDPTVMLFIIVTLFLFVGTFMANVPAMVILGPLLMPLAQNANVHPLHFGIAGVISLAFGLATPPYGLTLLISSEIAGINSIRAMREVGAFLLAMLVILVLVVVFPNLSLGLPKIVMPTTF